MEGFNSDFRYEQEKGKQLEKDGPLRKQAWVATQNYYDLYTKFLTADAVYYETRVAQYDKYIEFELTDFLAEMGSDLGVIGWETISTTIDAFVRECVEGMLTKVVADYTVVLGVTGSPNVMGGGRTIGGRFADCAADALKDSIVQMFVSVTKINFLDTVENSGIPRRVGEYWWDELIIGEAKKKPGFIQAVKDSLNGFKRGVSDAASGRLSKESKGAASGLVVRSIKQFRRKYIRHITKKAYEDFLLKKAAARMRAQIRRSNLPSTGRLPGSYIRQTIEDVHKESAKDYSKTLKRELDMDAALGRAEIYEVVIKTGAKLVGIYMDFSAFNWNNEVGRYYDVKRCLEHWSKQADPEIIVQKLRASAAEYTAFLRSCDPKRDAEYDRILAEAEALLEQIDLSKIPIGLMKEFIELTKKIDEAVDIGSQNEENMQDAIRGFQRICQRDQSEWQAILDIVNRFPGDLQAAADAVTMVKQAADKACSVQAYDQVQTAASQAGEHALKVAQINSAFETAIQGLNLEQERVPAAEPSDADQFLSDLRSLQTSLKDLKRRIEEGYKIREEQLTLIKEGLSKAGRFQSDRAKAAASKFSEFLKQVQAISIPNPEQIPPYEQKLSDLITSIEDTKQKLDEAIKCTESLPDVHNILVQARQTKNQMRTHMQAAAIGKQRAEICVADWVAKVTQAVMEDVRACRFEAAEAKFVTLPTDAAIRNELRWELQTAKTNDQTANSVYDRVEEHYRQGSIVAAHGLVTSLPKNIGCVKTQARRGPLESKVVSAFNSKNKADAAIKACRFDDARAAMGGITGETELRTIIRKNISNREIPANERLHKIRWLIDRVRYGEEQGFRAVSRIEQILAQAKCPNVKQAALDAIARLQHSGDNNIDRALAAMQRCDLDKAWNLMSKVPMQNTRRDSIYSRLNKLIDAQEAAKAALKSAGKLSGSNKYSAAVKTLDKALAKKPCAKTAARLQRARGLIARFQSIYAAVRTCKFERADKLLGSTPDGSAHKRLSNLNQRSKSAMRSLRTAQKALSQGRRTQARNIAKKILGQRYTCKEVHPLARRILARAKPLPKPKPKPVPRRPRGREDHQHPPSSDSQGQVSPICQRYAAQMQSLGNIQRNLASRMRPGISQRQGRAVQSQVISNTRKIHALIDASRRAGCHNFRMPQQYRRQFDRQFGR